MSAEDETKFQSSNKCQICKKLFVAGDNNQENKEVLQISGSVRGSVILFLN